MRLVALMFLLGCGPSQARPTVDPVPPERDAGTPARETEACRVARLEMLADMARSRGRACRADGDCATVTNPGSAVSEFDEVVHAADAAAFQVRSEGHLATCGAYIHHEPIDAVRMVEAHCAGTCQASETVLHIDPIE